MSPQVFPSVLRRRVLCVVVSACLLVGLLPVVVSAGTHAGAVGAAEQRLHRAEAQAEGVEAALDRAAAEYERAWAHSLRLAEELDEAAGTVERAHDREERAREALRQRLAAAYRAPHTDLALATSIMEAPDAATAVHRASLVSRLTVRSAAEVDAHGDAERRAAEALQQRRIIVAGAAQAAKDQERRAEELRGVLADARAQVRDAEQDLARARETAARMAAMPRGGTTGTGTTAVAVRADGKACPVGGQTGFIDSWGYPRSGGRSHQGVDMFSEYGTPLQAASDGLVRRVWFNTLGGLSIDLLGDDGDRYYYAHLSSVAVVDGQRVRAGEVVGAVGDSGNARGTPPHLHWQYHPGDGPPVNPYPLAHALCR